MSDPEALPPRGRDPVTRYVTAGQVSFALLIALCVALRPGLVLKASEGGMSNYGVHARTVIPYSLALAIPAVSSWVGANYARAVGRRASYVVVLRVYAVLIALTLLSTYGYTRDAPQKYLHLGCGIAITLFQTAASWWMFRLTRRYRALITVQLVGFALEVVTFLGALHVLFLTQLLTGGAFAFLLVATARDARNEPGYYRAVGSK